MDKEQQLGLEGIGEVEANEQATEEFAPDTGTGDLQEIQEPAPEEKPSDRDGVEYVKGESPEASAKRVLEAKEAQAAKPQEEAKISNDHNKQGKLDPYLIPPSRFDAKTKETFQRLPNNMKRAINEMVYGHEKHFSKTTEETGQLKQQLHQQLEENRYLTEAVQPFATRWAERGFTLPQGILNLASAEEKLMNPHTSLAAYVKLGENLGHINSQEAQAIIQQSGAKPLYPVEAPQESALQERIDRLEREIEHERNLKRGEPIANEWRAVINEVDEAGNFRHPRLQDQSYILSLRPRLEEVRRNYPNLSFGDTLRLAYQQDREESLKAFGYPSEQATSSAPSYRPHAGNDQINNNAIRAATVTVRGRTSPADLTPPKFDWRNAPPEALKSPEASARYVYEQLANGNGK